MSRSVPWLRVFAEGVVIVGSILLAFGIQAWWDGLQERDEEQRILASLKTEFEQTRSDLAYWISLHGKAEQNTRLLAELLDSAAPGAQLQVPDTLIAALLLGPTFDPVTATLDALSAGQLSIIRSTDLRLALATWPSRLFDARDEEYQARDFIDGQLIPRLVEESDLTAPTEFINEWIYGTLPDSVRDRHSPLRVSSQLRNLVAVRLWQAAGAIGELEGLLVATDSLLSLIVDSAGT